ncbi:DsbA family protein [Desulfobacterium sp. N47]|uniref:Thioredoxin-like fold domain-containing protein n=1 Tax=uncultured Desulfobacterium sp. TaxID=201089 RepID=E1YID7_9BACT|nr:unknown protein [uncultured Desulfobacterium sp.]
MERKFMACLNNIENWLNIKKTFALSIAILMLSAFIPVSTCFSGQLDEDKLFSAVCERLKEEKKIEGLTPKDLSLNKKVPIKVGNLSLWAVGILIKMKSSDNKPVNAYLNLVTDDKGQLQFENVTDIKTGKPLLERALAEITRVDINTKIGWPIFQGKGEKAVVVITDNFCPYCRTSYEVFQKVYSEKVKEVIFIYLPHNKLHPGSELACAVSAYVHNNKELQKYAKQVDDFIYQDLNVPKSKVADEADSEVYEAVKARFPWFAQKFSGLTMKKAFEKLKAGSNIEEQKKYVASLGITGTPIMFVEGMRIDGLDWKKFERYLSY